MPLDPKRLARDALELQSARPESSVGRETTGVTRAVRAALPAIKKLRQARVTWASIAEAMTRQGVRQRNGEALTASRLTSIVGQVEDQARRKAERDTAREQRVDVVPRASTRRTSTIDAPIPAEQLPPLPAATDEQSEETLRRKGLAELDQLLRKI